MGTGSSLCSCLPCFTQDTSSAVSTDDNEQLVEVKVDSTAQVQEEVDAWEYSKQLTKREVVTLLKDATLKNVDVFSPPLRFGKVVKVYDGDTVHIVAPLFAGVVSRFKVRVAGIDTPEIRTSDEWEKRAGFVAKELVSERILHKVVELTDIGNDKYGRVLAKIWLDETCIGDWLIAEGWAVPYSGSGPKLVKTTNWESKVKEFEAQKQTES